MTQSPQTRDELLGVLRAEFPRLAARFSVRRIGLFGSCVRDQADSDSDVDVLVDLDEPTFDNYMGLKLYLEDTLGRPVDVVMTAALRPRLRDHILREVQYAA